MTDCAEGMWRLVRERSVMGGGWGGMEWGLNTSGCCGI